MKNKILTLLIFLGIVNVFWSCSPKVESDLDYAYSHDSLPDSIGWRIEPFYIGDIGHEDVSDMDMGLGLNLCSYLLPWENGEFSSWDESLPCRLIFRSECIEMYVILPSSVDLGFSITKSDLVLGRLIFCPDTLSVPTRMWGVSHPSFEAVYHYNYSSMLHFVFCRDSSQCFDVNAFVRALKNGVTNFGFDFYFPATKDQPKIIYHTKSWFSPIESAWFNKAWLMFNRFLSGESASALVELDYNEFSPQFEVIYNEYGSSFRRDAYAEEQARLKLEREREQERLRKERLRKEQAKREMDDLEQALFLHLLLGI